MIGVRVIEVLLYKLCLYDAALQELTVECECL